jgi:hypothetical protein
MNLGQTIFSTHKQESLHILPTQPSPILLGYVADPHPYL